jgi:hypothetical protein
MSRSATTIMLAAILVIACGNPPSPTPTAVATPSATPTPEPASLSPSPSASASALAGCTGAEVQATGGPWGGAAGSRGSDIIVENVGTTTCLLPAAATVALVDQDGAVVLSNAPAQAGPGPELAPGGRVGFSLVLGNWCDQSVNLPLGVQLALAGATIDIGSLTLATTDELPPCNGPGQPATLTTTEWQSADPG